MALTTLSASGKDSDIAFEEIVVDRHPAVFGVVRQIFPLVQSVGYGIAKLAVRQDLRGDFIEPFLEGVQDGDAVLLAEAANALIWRFASVPRGSVKIPRVWSLETPPPDGHRQRY